MKLILASAMSLLFGTTAVAETWHVSVTGDDAAIGTAEAPWRTIQRAADAVAPGDVVSIHAGRYLGFTVDAVGTATQPIAFVADGDVMIDGSATADRDAIHIQGAEWVRIEGFTVTGAARAGISALDCDHITIRGNRSDANGRWGIFSAFCVDLLVEDNEASRSGDEHGIYASNSADRPVIRGNRVWGNNQCGIHVNGDIEVGGGDGVISDALIENNVIFDNGRNGGSGINGDGVVRAVIRNNVLDGNHASGISLYRINGGAPSTDNLVINNTVRMASDGRWAINLQDGASRNVLRNNILLHPAPARGAVDLCDTCDAVSDHNAVVGRFQVNGAIVDLEAWRSVSGGDATSFVATDVELFTSPAQGDLTLRAGSPAIDRGMADNAPALDVVGTARPQGAGVDIGAFESCDGTCTGGSDGDGDGSGSGDGTVDDGTGDPGDAPDVEAPVGAGCSVGLTGAGPLVWLALGVLALRRRQRHDAVTRGVS